jgi:hypothetical protein
VITIKQFGVTPSPVACGVPAIIRVRVEWGSGGTKSVRTCVTVPVCTFAGSHRVCQHRAGISPLDFLFEGAFACPPGGHHLQLSADAQATDSDFDSSLAFVDVQC